MKESFFNLKIINKSFQNLCAQLEQLYIQKGNKNLIEKKLYRNLVNNLFCKKIINRQDLIVNQLRILSYIWRRGIYRREKYILMNKKNIIRWKVKQWKIELQNKSSFWFFFSVKK